MTEGQTAVYLRTVPYEFTAEVAYRINRAPHSTTDVLPPAADAVPPAAPIGT